MFGQTCDPIYLDATAWSRDPTRIMTEIRCQDLKMPPITSAYVQMRRRSNADLDSLLKSVLHVQFIVILVNLAFLETYSTVVWAATV